jgi:dipeptidyl aminopeptidase/acylaminoacyl peptidase
MTAFCNAAPSRRLLAALLLIAALGAAPALAQDAPEQRATEAPEATGDAARWTPELSMRYHSLPETALSPDGERVAYVEREPLMESEQSEYRSQVYLADADGDDAPIQYTRGEASASSPRFSPNGRYLAFLSARSEEPQVWALRLRGGEAWQLTHAPGGVAGFAWSPSGDRVAYRMRDPKTAAQKTREREKRDVQFVGEDFRYTHLYVRPFTATEDTSLKAQRLTGGDFEVRGFDWSPDGERIVFAHQPDPRTNTGFTKSDLSTVPADSGAVEPLVTWEGADTDPHFSPDGQSVAFTSSGGTVEAVGLQDVYRVAADGSGDPQRMAATPDRSASLLRWAADGNAVLVSETSGTSRHVFAVPTSKDGTTRQITQGAGVFGAVSFGEEAETMAFTREDSDTPANVHVSSVSDFEARQVTDIHEDVPKPPMGRTELVEWTSPDGTEIEGLLTYPVGYEEGNAYPLILNVHGGPSGAYTRRFTGAPSIYMLQYFADNGYAILRPNPRGSTGYGKEFRYANVEDWGYGDFEDLMAGIDHAVERGVADPDSLALMGWSYGGYMTSFAVTRTDRFAAASMGAGLSNLISMTGTTDIPAYLRAHMGGPVWENTETYEKHSAIYRVDEVSTPTQIIHGAEDDRVPTSQGREFYRALTRLGVPTEMVVYPRTPHGPREPKFVMDVSQRIMNWFEQHVRGVAPAGNASTASTP